ncbi:hypothetical protein GC176_04030 [bacterium]|nr:hypothetical protein [bacterium]
MLKTRCGNRSILIRAVPGWAAILCLVTLVGCSTEFWKTAQAAEASGDTSDVDSVTTDGVNAAGPQMVDAGSTQTERSAGSGEATDGEASSAKTDAAASPGSGKLAASPAGSARQDSSGTKTSGAGGSVETHLETLRTSLSRTTDYRKVRTKKVAGKYATEAALQIDRGLAAVTEILGRSDASLEARREAWKGRLTLLCRGEQLKLPGFPERLDAAVVEAASLPEFQAEAEYGSGLLLINRDFKSGKLQETLEHLQAHARTFPNGESTARLFVTYARDCGERGNFNAGILCCKLALWQLNSHPDVGAVRNLLENLEAGRTIDPSQDKVQQMLEKEVVTLRQSLPIRIDKVTTCTSITTTWHAVTYSFRLSTSADLVKANRDKLKTTVTNMARSTYQTQQLLENGIALHYVYADSDGRELLRFTVTK